MIEIHAYVPAVGLRSGVGASELPDLLRNRKARLWVDLLNPTPEESKVLTEVFSFHPLEVEDCQSIHLPKIDEFEDHLFILFQGLAAETTLENFVTRQIAFFVGKNYLVTYHHHDSRSIRTAKEACRKNPQRLAQGADGLLHTILDYAVDMYFPIIEQLDREIDRAEERVLTVQDNTVINTILVLKRSILELRKISVPQQEIVRRLSRDEFPFVSERHRIYYRDVYDHLVRVSGLAESYREMVGSLQDAHLSMVNNRLNETMKVLALFTSIFIPLSFIASVYGMNFDMPEFGWHRGYLFAWLLMGALLVGTL
ncbi:MAG: magnesium/cobalt transporter CorA, partial [Acidobacteria bacterium]|nr:magnesium/cobalt transporter CorA [Acidobacteriota bacterium]